MKRYISFLIIMLMALVVSTAAIASSKATASRNQPTFVAEITQALELVEKGTPKHAKPRSTTLQGLFIRYLNNRTTMVCTPKY